jgi:glucose/arabinose dehydrogenase
MIPNRFVMLILLGSSMLLSIGCATPGIDGVSPAGERLAVTPPVLPQEREGLVAESAVSHTLRPAKREATEERIRQIRLPAGFEIGVFARDLENPRILRVNTNGDVYVSEREAGRVRLLRDSNGDGRADVSRVVASGIGDGLGGVHGLEIREGQLYMMTNKELFAAPIQADGGLGERRLLIDDLPDGGQHPNRTMAFGPDGMLYVSVGSTCNACPEPNEEHATMLRMRADGSERTIFAKGLRNTIGFAWHPVNRRLFGADHNSDHRGNDIPAEEINEILEGRHYGWPWCWGNRQIDNLLPMAPEEGTRQEFCAGTEPSLLMFQGHSAPMQMVYYTGDQFPAEYRNDAFIALRGSWNRNPPVGYGVARLRHDANGVPQAIEMFADGWLIEGGRAQFGRLTGVAQAGDGSLLVGDDSGGVIYRISYRGQR